ncbi:ATP-binding protein [Nesterenkonia suensis]
MQAVDHAAAQLAGRLDPAVERDKVFAEHLRIQPRVIEASWWPRPDPLTDPEGRVANTYDMAVYDAFPKLAEANQRLQQVAVSRGLETIRRGSRDFTARDIHGREMTFGLSLSEASSPVSGYFTGDKQLTRHFLQQASAPVPPGEAFRAEATDEALVYAESIGYPVVVKPLAGKGGVGVVAGITDPAGVRRAVRQLGESGGRFIVERHVPGQDYRIYVAHGKVLSVIMRRPASITGDGRRTIAELVLEKNLVRRQNPHTRRRLIQADDVADHQLERAGLTWDAVPEVGTTVTLASAANISRGGDSTEVLDETHPSILEAAVRAVDSIPGLNQAGVDFLLPDHRLSLAEQEGGICEINTTPALMANAVPMFGNPQPVAEQLVELTAEAQGLRLSPPRPTSRMTMHIEGIRDAEGTCEWVMHHARAVDIDVEQPSVEDQAVSIILDGDSERIGALAAAMYSVTQAQRPDSVRLTPCADPSAAEAAHD